MLFKFTYQQALRNCLPAKEPATKRTICHNANTKLPAKKNRYVFHYT